MHTNQNRQCHRTIREDSSSTVDGTFTEHKFQVNFKAAGLAIFFAKIWSRLFRTSHITWTFSRILRAQLSDPRAERIHLPARYTEQSLLT